MVDVCPLAGLNIDPFFPARCPAVPQGKRTAAERRDFDRMLLNVNLLFIGCSVLIMMDRSYLSRFWYVHKVQ